MNFSFDTSFPIHFDSIEQIEDSRFVRGKIWICHTGENRNRSFLTKEVIQDAIPSLANVPVLGFIREDSVNEIDFAGHEQRIVIDKDGTKIEYLGRMYGQVPETNNAKFETKMCEDGIEREFLTAEVILHTKFSECIEIVQRDGVHNHSMELYPDSIKGRFNKDKLFEFTEFKFEGLCLLGEDVTPAMIGSSLELFSQFNYSQQLINMLQEFNTKFSGLTKKNDTKNFENNINKGGERVNEKLELFAKFPTLAEQDVADLKVNVEQYSLEELEIKLTSLFKKQNQQEPHIEQQSNNNSFSLTSKQFTQELIQAISQEQYVDRWGDSCRQYWYIDHDDTRVYAEDGKSGYLPVGISYVLTGDTVTIDYETKKRIKWVPQDMEDQTVTTVSLMSIERSEADFSKVSDKLTSDKNEVEAKYTQLNKDLTSVQEKYSTLEDQFNRMKTQYEEVNGKYTSKIEQENETKLNALFDEFSKELTNDEIVEAKNEISNYTYEEIETKLFALVGKKKAKFSVIEKPKYIDLNTESKNKKSSGKSYDELFEKYSE